jgi:hypothetical protein
LAQQHSHQADCRSCINCCCCPCGCVHCHRLRKLLLCLCLVKLAWAAAAACCWGYLDLLVKQLPGLSLHSCHVSVRLRQALNNSSCQLQSCCPHGIAAALCKSPASTYDTRPVSPCRCRAYCVTELCTHSTGRASAGLMSVAALLAGRLAAAAAFKLLLRLRSCCLRQSRT